MRWRDTLPGQGAQVVHTTVPQNVSDGHADGYELD